MSGTLQDIGQVKKTTGSGFGEVLEKSLASVNGQMQEADHMAAGLVSGDHSNIHETMIAMEKANIAFKLVTKVQSKVIDAYKEVMRMQL